MISYLSCFNELEKISDAHVDKIPGGLADNKRPSDFSSDALKKGAKVESEHTTDKSIAQEIAMDHLSEDPKYYDKLQKMEKKAAKLSGGTKFEGGVANSIGLLGGIQTASLIDPTHVKKFVFGLNEKEANHVINAMNKKYKSELKDTVVRLNSTDTIDDIKRIVKNKKNTALEKFIGVVQSPIIAVQANVRRADHYNPIANSISSYAGNPHVLAHELGHAADWNKRKGLRRSAYTVGTPLLTAIGQGVDKILSGSKGKPIVPVGSVGGVSNLIHMGSTLAKEYRATDNAIKSYGKASDARKVLLPAYGTYVGATLATVAALGHVLTRPETGTHSGPSKHLALLPFVGAAVGHGAAALYNRAEAKRNLVKKSSIVKYTKPRGLKKQAFIEPSTALLAPLLHLGANATWKTLGKTGIGQRMMNSQMASGLVHGIQGKKINPIAANIANYGLGPESMVPYSAGRGIGEQISGMSGPKRFKYLKKLRKNMAMAGPDLQHAPVAHHVVPAINRVLGGETGFMEKIPTVASSAPQTTGQKLISGGLGVAAGVAAPESLAHMGINIARQNLATSRLGKNFMRDQFIDGLENRPMSQLKKTVTDYGLSPAALNTRRIGDAVRETALNPQYARPLRSLVGQGMGTPFGVKLQQSAPGYAQQVMDNPKLKALAQQKLKELSQNPQAASAISSLQSRFGPSGS